MVSIPLNISDLSMAEGQGISGQVFAFVSISLNMTNCMSALKKAFVFYVNFPKFVHSNLQTVFCLVISLGYRESS
jgi:hypothetical protein